MSVRNILLDIGERWKKLKKQIRPEEAFRRFYKSKLLRLFLLLIGGIRKDE